jgi:hypothetical protein
MYKMGVCSTKENKLETIGMWHFYDKLVEQDKHFFHLASILKLIKMDIFILDTEIIVEPRVFIFNTNFKRFGFRSYDLSSYFRPYHYRNNLAVFYIIFQKYIVNNAFFIYLDEKNKNILLDWLKMKNIKVIPREL